MKLFAVAGMMLGVVLAGCSVQVKMNEKNETDLGSHHVVVKPGGAFTSSSSSSSGDTQTYRYRSGDVSVEITDEELIVNKVRYGQLAPGDDILVDHGVVYVGGEQREGTPMSAEEIMAAAPVKETVKELAGYTVTVRPGASFTTKTEIFGKHILSLGDTKVAIKKDRLFVNETAYGALKPGDTIVVEQGAVSVSGQTRHPEE
jgi:hypothetical protein